MPENRGAGRPHNYQSAQQTSGKNYLLAIGIDAYQHWQPLANAVKDAQEFVQVLTTQYQFEESEVFTLYNEAATEANIYQAIREMKHRLQPQDSLVVYYSGHGHYDEDFDEGYWIPVDARPDDESDFISNANIVKRLNALDTQHTLLIVDSCFSGSLVVRKRNVFPDEKFKSRRILASGRHETVSDGKKGENSPFAAGLLTVLRKNTTPKVDTTSVIRYVKDYVYGKAKQHPVDGRIQNSADEGGEFVFHLRKDEEAVWQEVSRV
ncbi:MAG: caspase family protein, partial [Bacteroidetes bacterium]